MTDAPYEPIGVPEPFGTDVLDQGRSGHGYGLAGVRIPCPTRRTLARLTDGSLRVHSPIAPTDAMRREVEALGPVGHTVVPDGLHATYAPAWAEPYARRPARTP